MIGEKSAPKEKNVVIRGILLMAILSITFLTFASTIGHEFTNWDDPVYVINNPSIRTLTPQAILGHFQQTLTGIYVPLTTLSFALEYSVAQLDPSIYHFNNILIHMAVVALVFLFAHQCGLSLVASGIAALVFGIHPMHVESVAWITERKDVLYSFFYMLSLCSYWRYLQNQNKATFGMTVFWGLLSMLAKPMAVSLPLILLLCDLFYGRKLKKSVFIEKIFFFVYIIPILCPTFVYLFDEKSISLDIGEALLIGVWTFVFYIKSFFLFTDFSPYYSLPQPLSLLNAPYAISVCIFVIFAFILFRYRRNRWVVFSFLFYIFSIFFMLRFKDVSRVDNLCIVADRFMYLPSLGFCILIGAVSDYYWSKWHNKKLLKKIFIVFLGVIFSLMAVKSMKQCLIWKNGITLWSKVIDKYPDVAFAYNNRGNAYSRDQFFNDALKDYSQALIIDPNYKKVYNNRGSIYGQLNQFDLALSDFNKVIRLDPHYAFAYYNRGKTYLNMKQPLKALDDFHSAIINHKNYFQAYISRGQIYFDTKKYDLALNDLNQAIEINSSYSQAYELRSKIFFALNRKDKAERDSQRAKELFRDQQMFVY